MPHRVSDNEQLVPSQSAMCREETAALLAMIKAGHNQVALRIRQTRTLMSNDFGRSPTSFPSVSSVSSPDQPSELLVALNSGVAAEIGANHATRPPKAVRLLIQQIASDKFLTLQGEWSESWIKAKEFTSVLDLLHFAVEYFLPFPLGVFCAFLDRRDGLSIALFSADFFGARQWDLRIARVCLATNRAEAQAAVIWVDETDQIDALRYLRG